MGHATARAAAGVWRHGSRDDVVGGVAVTKKPALRKLTDARPLKHSDRAMCYVLHQSDRLGAVMDAGRGRVQPRFC